jgi:hypothetical protein
MESHETVRELAAARISLSSSVERFRESHLDKGALESPEQRLIYKGGDKLVAAEITRLNFYPSTLNSQPSTNRSEPPAKAAFCLNHAASSVFCTRKNRTSAGSIHRAKCFAKS